MGTSLHLHRNKNVTDFAMQYFLMFNIRIFKWLNNPIYLFKLERLLIATEKNIFCHRQNIIITILKRIYREKQKIQS